MFKKQRETNSNDNYSSSMNTVCICSIHLFRCWKSINTAWNELSQHTI